MINKMQLFIEEKIANKQRIYLTEPAQIDTDFNREIEDLRAYHGRELLELIQNADDEATDDLPKRILISFKDSVLSISNYGEPFSDAGILSLMYSNRSPKREKTKDSIGNKGTGFRSILSWAKYITINSAELHIQFSKEYSQRILMETFSREGTVLSSETKAATLAFPEWIHNGRSYEDFTTTISIHVKDRKDVEDIRKQIETLDENLLLFLNRTELLDIEMPEKSIRFIKRTDKKTVVLTKVINGSVTSERTWTLNRCEGVVADDLDESKEKNYNIVIAYCNNEQLCFDDQRVYSYFRTDVDFPYPFLMHASFSLDQSRNHLNKSEANETILRAAAKLLVETAAKVASRKPSNYGIVDLIIAQRTLTVDISSFETYVIEAARDASVFPNVNGKYISFSDAAVWYTNGLSKYIKGKEFEHCLQHIDSQSKLERFINKLSKGQKCGYPYKVISALLSSMLSRQDETDFSTENGREIIRNRVKLAIAFYDKYNWEISCAPLECPGFFINTSGRTIPYDPEKPAFLFEDELSIESLPDFIDFEIIHPYMQDYMMKYLDRDREDTFNGINELCQLNVRQLKLEEISEYLCNTFDTIIQKSKVEGIKAKWEKLIIWFWHNQNSFNSKGLKIRFPFLTKEGNYKFSDELYYGIEYGNALCEKLFLKHQGLLIADIRHLIPLECQQEQLRSFLCLFGIEALPRIKEESQSNFVSNYKIDYLHRVFEQVQFPLQIDSKSVFKTIDDLMTRLKKVSIRKYKIDELTFILNECQTETIIEWILTDAKLHSIIESKKDSITSRSAVSITWDLKQNSAPVNQISEPYSYVYYCFTTIPWITVNGRRYLPGNCMIDLENDCDLSPFLVSLNISDYIKKANGNPRELKKRYSDVLQNIGVKKGYGEGGFPELPLSTIYSVLMLLPQKVNSERIAARMYESFVTSNEKYSVDMEKCKERKLFFAEGKVLCDDGYYSLSEARYLSEKSISKRILESCHVLSLPSRRSVRTVETYLGVKHLEVHEELYGTPVVHPENAKFTIEYRKFVPLAFAYRLAYINADSDVKDEARKISNITVTICSELKSSFEGAVYELYDYEFITTDNHNAYLKVPESFSVVRDMWHNLALASAISKVLCSILDISSALPRFRELFSLGNNKDREELLLQDIESKAIILRAKEELDFSENLKDEFIRIVSTITGRDYTNTEELTNAVDFDNFSRASNMQTIIRLFAELGADVSDYNAEIPSVPIDLCSYYEEEINRRKASLEDQYKVSCFRRLEKGSLKEKKALVQAFDDFRSKSIPVENTVYFDINGAIEKALGVDHSAESVDLVSLYNANMDTWAMGLEDKSALEAFLTEPENVSLVYYGEFDELNRLYSAALKSVLKDDYLSEEPQLQLIKVVTGTTIATGPSVSPSGFGSQKIGFARKDNSKEKVRTGFRGEQLVYKALSESDKYARVNWLSENAKKAGVCPEGRAGLGYDIEAYDEEGNRLLIEVKASKQSVFDGIRFQLSDNEYRTALNNPNAYHIYYVGKVFDSEPEMYLIDNLIAENEISSSFSAQCKKEFIITASIKINE